MLNEHEIRKMLVGLSDDELNRMRELARAEAEQREEVNVRSFKPGDKVAFEDRSGRSLTGVVEYTNQKSVSVKASDGRRWRVAPCFLKKVA